jgi:tRNA modification GTPase
VGKSTLANQLFGRERSITADVAGTTRDWVGEIANIDGLAVTLVDTPGIRPTPDPLERAAIAAGAEKIRESDLVIHVLDATAEPGREIDRGTGFIAINKIDREPTWKFTGRFAGPILISAKTGLGMDQLRKRILRHFGLEADWKPRPCWWTPRQREILAEAIARKLSSGEIARMIF